jgi:hypothetical protein
MGLTCHRAHDAGFPVPIAGRPPHPWLNEATPGFTRVTTCPFALPPFETLSDRLNVARYRSTSDPTLRG